MLPVVLLGGGGGGGRVFVFVLFDVLLGFIHLIVNKIIAVPIIFFKLTFLMSSFLFFWYSLRDDWFCSEKHQNGTTVNEYYAAALHSS